MGLPSGQHLRGLISAAFTPFQADGELNLDRIPTLVDHLHSQGVAGIYALGSTGEGISLRTEERRAVAEAFIDSARDRLPVMVQVGHESLAEARRLAAHAESCGADALSSVSPSYFAPRTLDALIDCMAEIASAAPSLPFYYYHIPTLTRVSFSMLEFLQKAGDRIPTLRGIKYTSTELHEYQACVEFDQGRYDVLYGRDEMLLPAMSVGAQGAVGSTYNLLAPIFNRVISSVENNDWESARHAQSEAVAIVQIFVKYQVLPSCKATLKMIGVDCGECRLPLEKLSSEKVQHLKQDLEAANFFKLIGAEAQAI